MVIFYSASKNGFYPDFMKSEYQQAGSWPDDLKEISDRWFNYLLGKQTEGKVIVPDEYGLPVLQKCPAPSHDALVLEAKEKRQELIDSAIQSIAVIQLKQMNGRSLTAKELTRLNDVLDYIEALEAIATETAPDIVWPEVPDVA